MATYSNSIYVAMIARIGSGRGYGAFLKEYETLGGFEGGAGRVHSLKCTVIERLESVRDKGSVVFSTS